MYVLRRFFGMSEAERQATPEWVTDAYLNEWAAEQEAIKKAQGG